MWQEVPCQGPDGAAWVINTGGRDAPRLYTVAHPRTYKPTSTFLQVVYNIKTHILTNFETQVVYNFVWTHKVYGRSFDTTVPLQTHNNKQQQQYFSQLSDTLLQQNGCDDAPLCYLCEGVEQSINPGGS